MMRGIIVIWVLLCSVSIFISTSATTYGETLPQSAVKGVLNLQDPLEGQTIPLHGEWEFYWGQLLTPEEIRQLKIQPAYIQVPSTWRDHVIQGEQISEDGYATYRLLLQIAPRDIGDNKALFLRYVGSAYQIWIDGQHKGGIGSVGKSREESTPLLMQNQFFFEPKQETVEIVIQVSNYSFRESGIFGEVKYGDSEALVPSVIKDLSRDIFLISGFLVLGLYHLIIYLTKRKELSNLMIGAAGVVFAVRIFLLSEFLAFSLFPADSWELIVRIEYLIEAIGFVLIFLLMKHMYSKEVHRSIFLLSCVFSALYIGYIMLTPVKVFTGTLLLNVAVMGFILLYYVFYVGVVAALRKREGARINLIAVFVIVVAMANDTLYYAQLVENAPIIDYCVLLFILFQAIIVSYRHAQVHNRNQALAIELVQTNNSLEEKVQDRTKELNERNEELSQLQKMRTQWLANIAHDMGSPILGIQTYLHLMKEGIIQPGNQDLVQQMSGKSNDMKRLIDDLFELSKLETKALSFHFEPVQVKQFVEKAYYKFEPDLRQENMQLQLGRVETICMGREAVIRIDPFRINQVLQNYIGNAVKFSQSMGAILVFNCYILGRSGADKETYELCFEVVDQGVGISEEELPQVFQRFYKKQEGNAGGSGLGLSISKEIIELHGGRVGVTSALGKGSTFYFILPVVVDAGWLPDDS